MPLNRGTAQQQIDLIVIVTIAAKILNDPQTSLPIRNCRIQIMLLAVLVDGEPFECQIPAGAELGFNRAGVEDGRLHPHLRHPVFDHCELDRDDTRHLDGAAEGDFPVALREVQVADGEFGPWDVHGEVDFGAAGEVLDVTVSSVFGTALVKTLSYVQGSLGAR